MKKCFKCKINYDLSSFYHRAASPDGYMTVCKGCCKHRQRLYRRRYRAKVQYRQNEQNRFKRRVEIGQCFACSDAKLPHHRGCLFHWVKSIIWRMKDYSKTKLDKTELYKLYSIMFEKAKATKTCPYTGEELQGGLNMELDHKIPRKRFPELEFDPDNLQWVSWTYNTAKGDRTDEEFNRHYKITYIP